MLIEKIRLHSAYGALMVMDSHFNRPLTMAVLSFNGKTVSYRIKPEGYYVLTQPTVAGEICRVECPGYAPLEIVVEHDENGCFFALAGLSHLPGHPQMNYTRKVIGNLRQKGRPLIETPFTLALCSRIPGLMLIEDAEEDAMVLRLNTEEETRLISQAFCLPDMPETRNMITGIKEANGYKLAKPLGVSLSQGQQLIPVWDLATDYKGEFIFPYKPHLLREAEAEISITCGSLNHSCTVNFPGGAEGQLSVSLE